MHPPHCTVQNEWNLLFAGDAPPDIDVVDAILQLGPGNHVPFRRSRHATTFLITSSSGSQQEDLFVKHFDPPEGWEWMKSWIRGSRSSRAARLTNALRAAGFSVPAILFYGVHHKSQREVLVTMRAAGDGPIIALRTIGNSINSKREVLRTLGNEIARLHGSGFIHGDLTPFNVRIVVDEPPRFAFIDNDRTRRNVVIR
ncbi:MAG TPA: lipopolysaccharide kinase InaA family protein, partial [Candidatus Binataceae bacterium]|nr:lipopolysaccharide kinase InaA family protein [Candidatus Binataceae bacterium]